MTARKFLSLSCIAVLFLVCVAGSECQVTSFTPGQVIHDTDGKPIKAFAGGISYFNGTYYWYGEFKNGDFPTAEFPAIRARTSSIGSIKGIWFPGCTRRAGPFRFPERPHVIYNDKTKGMSCGCTWKTRSITTDLPESLSPSRPQAHSYQQHLP